MEQLVVEICKAEDSNRDGDPESYGGAEVEWFDLIAFVVPFVLLISEIVIEMERPTRLYQEEYVTPSAIIYEPRLR
jgi:hypothetical protein